MPVYVALADAHAHRRMGGGAATRYPLDYCPESEAPARVGLRYRKSGAAHPGRDDEVVAEIEVVHRFEAPDADAARVYFERLQQSGCVADREAIHKAPALNKVWRYRGDGKHLGRRIATLGTAHVHLKHVQANPFFRDITGLINQVVEMYWQASRFDGTPRLTPQQRAAAAASLDHADRHLDHLYVIFAGAADAIDEAREAMGIEGHRRYTKPEIKPPPAPADEPRFDVETAPDPTDQPPVEHPPKPHRRTPAR